MVKLYSLFLTSPVTGRSVMPGIPEQSTYSLTHVNAEIDPPKTFRIYWEPEML